MRHKAAGSEAANELASASTFYHGKIFHAVFANDGRGHRPVIFDAQSDGMSHHQFSDWRIRSRSSGKCPHPIRHGHHAFKRLSFAANVGEFDRANG